MAAVVDTPSGARWVTASQAGPASYAAGGFLVDLSATLSFLGYLEPIISTRGVLPNCLYEITLNRDLSGNLAPGKAAVKVMRARSDVATSGAVTGNPGGTTVQASKAAAGTTTGSGHTHSIDHDHPSTVSSTPTNSGGAVASGAVAILTHTHNVDIAAFTGNTGSSTHTHDRSFEYDHNHALTTASTAVAYTEITATTNLSGVTWTMLAAGF